MPTGNATAMPAISMAATNRIFATLNTTPPRNAYPKFLAEAWLKSAKKPRPSEPMLPSVKANNTVSSSTPMQ